MATVISNPHQIPVDKNGEVVAAVMGGSSVADVRDRCVLCASPGETVQRSGDCEGAMRVEGSFVLGQDSVIGDCSVDVGYQDGLVIAKELA